MPDIAMCNNKTCPSRVNCYRYRAKPNRYRQSYVELQPNSSGKCEEYWSTNGFDDKSLEPLDEAERIAGDV